MVFFNEFLLRKNKNLMIYKADRMNLKRDEEKIGYYYRAISVELSTIKQYLYILNMYITGNTSLMSFHDRKLSVAYIMACLFKSVNNKNTKLLIASISISCLKWTNCSDH